MCLNNDPIEVKKLLKKKTFKCYKRLYLIQDHSGLAAPVMGTRYQPGWNISDSKLKKPCCSQWGQISHGIHAYRNLAYVKRINQYSTYVIVECTAYVEDLIGANINQILFKKVYIEEKEFKRALALAKRKQKDKNRIDG